MSQGQVPCSVMFSLLMEWVSWLNLKAGLLEGTVGGSQLIVKREVEFVGDGEAREGERGGIRG